MNSTDHLAAAVADPDVPKQTNGGVTSGAARHHDLNPIHAPCLLLAIDIDSIPPQDTNKSATPMRGGTIDRDSTAELRPKTMLDIGALGSGSVGLKAISGVIGILRTKFLPKAAVSTAVATSIASPSARSRAAACVERRTEFTTCARASPSQYAYQEAQPFYL
jgi:hypothetical protein